MSIILEYYNEIYANLKNLNDKLVSLYQRLEIAKDTCSQEISNANQRLQNKLGENNQHVIKVKAFVEIAKTHSINHVEATAAKHFDSRMLARLSVQMNSGLVDDPFACQLYTEATAQLLFLEKERIDLAKETDSHIRLIKNEYKSIRIVVGKKISEIQAKIKSYLYLDKVTEFVEFLRCDKKIFREGAKRVNIPSNLVSTISVGMMELPFLIPKGMELEMLNIFGEFCNTSKATIFVPVNISFEKGKVVIAEYETIMESYVLKGIQNVILNIARYYEKEFTQIVFIDPIRFNSSSLGCLSRLCGTANSYIDSVPTSIEDIRRKLKAVISEINIQELRDEQCSLHNSKRALYIFHDFPQAYDATMISQIQQLCVNAEYYGIMVVLTHNNSTNNHMMLDTYQFLQNIALNIKTNSEGEFIFYEENNVHNSFLWYVAPEQLPKDIERKYINEKPTVDLSNDYNSRIGFYDNPVYQKGVRKLEKIPFGIDFQGELQYLDFENSNFATFICGAARSGKSTLLHTIISGMIKNNHPDDIEIWLVDFKMTEFSRYINHLPPHVRYIILDESPELVYDIIDRLTEILIKRQNIFKGKWLKLGEVPVERYMPAIIVIIDEFSVMSQIIADSVASNNENYSVKLQMLLAKGAALGLHFIFASQGFTSGTRGLNDFSKKQIQQRIAMKTEYNEIKETLDLKSASDGDKMLMEQLAVHHTLLRIPLDEQGNHLKLSQVLYISDYVEQENLIDKISESIRSVNKYDATDCTTYINKKPMIIDGNLYLAYNNKKMEMDAYYNSHKEIFKNEYALFVGEPRRMMSLYPITMSNEFCENILIVAPVNEKMAASSVILSIARSLEMQNQSIFIWTTKKNAIYRQIKFECKEQFSVKNDLIAICEEIKKIKGKIQTNSEDNKFFVLLGVEALFIDMAYQHSMKREISNSKQVIYEKRANNEPDLNTILDYIATGKPINDIELFENKSSNKNILGNKNSYDAREDLKFILTNGSRLGYHFILVFGTVGDIRQTKIDVSLFKHKILFRTAKSDAMSVMGSANASVVSELESHSFRYSNGLDHLSFRPYLHPGLSWDGWKLSGNDVVNDVDEEEYLL